jgi:BlaI family transcriptional regulator, penicillinase repressor
MEKGKELTKAEEQIMHVMWTIEKGFVKDIVNKLPNPKPAYNTVSTVVRILEKKGFIGHTAFGNTHEYYPLISKEIYTGEFMGNILKEYFSDSFKQLVSFFTNTKNLSFKEIDEIIKIMENEMRKQVNKK